MGWHWKVNGVEACRAKETLYRADGSHYDPPFSCAYSSLQDVIFAVNRVRAQYPEAAIEIVEGPCLAGMEEHDDWMDHCEQR